MIENIHLGANNIGHTGFIIRRNPLGWPQDIGIFPYVYAVLPSHTH